MSDWIIPAQFLDQSKSIEELESELEAKDRRIAELKEVLTAVTGWREYDWAEGFDRRTAELIADHVRDKLEANNG